MLFRNGKSWIVDLFVRRGWLVKRRSMRRRSGAWRPLSNVPAECLEERILLSTITVTTLDDNLTPDGKVTLREAIEAANNNSSVDGSAIGSSSGQDEIIFQPGLTGTIDLDPGLGQLTISSSLKIQGLGAANTIIDGNFNSRIFTIDVSAGDVTIAGLTIQNGQISADGGANGTGGGIRNFSPGTLTLANDTVSGNRTTGLSGAGGAIWNYVGTLAVIDSSITGNSTGGVNGDGGAVYNFSGNVTITNSTLAGNTTAANSSDGGAIASHAGSVTLINDTFDDNHTQHGLGGGIYLSTSATIRNSIFAGGSDRNGSNDLYYSTGPAVVITHSLIGTNAGTNLTAAPVGSPDGNGNLIGTDAAPIDPLLAPLNFNGGSVQTMALLPGSPAINMGKNSLAVDPATSSALTSDERGSPFVRIAGGTVDMGAYEDQTVALSLVVNSADDTMDPGYNPAHLTLRDAVALANGSVGPDTISFAPALNRVPIVLSSEIDITDDVTIAGNGSVNTVIDGSFETRIFTVESSASDVTLSGLTLQNAETTAVGASGAGIQNLSNGTLTLLNDTFSLDRTHGDNALGGAISNISGTVIALDSAFHYNGTYGNGANGGAIYNQSGKVIITNSTLSSNVNFSDFGTGNGSGGAIDSPGGLVTLTNDTFSGNISNAGVGGSIALGSAASLIVRNSILAHGQVNSSPNELYLAPGSSVVITHSLIDTNAGTSLTAAPVGAPDANGNLIGSAAQVIDPHFGLNGLGGQTTTFSLLPGSPAIDAGSNAEATDPGPDGIPGNGDDVPLTTDQRGAPFARIFNGTVDMGAYEFQTLSISLVVNSADDVLDAVYNPAHLTLPDAVSLANGSVGPDTITFAPALNGVPIELTHGMGIADDLTIQGNGANSTIIDAGHKTQAFFVSGTGNTTFDGLTIENGLLTFGGVNGGAISSRSTGTLTIENSTLSGNSTTADRARGGAVYASKGPVVVTNSNFTGNYTTGLKSFGGAIFSLDGAVTITNSTFASNHTTGDHASGGAVYAFYGAVTVSNSTISGSSTAGPTAPGGAILAHTGVVTLESSTLSGNSTGGQSSSGGAVYARYGNVVVTDSTLSGNSTAGANSRGGAIYGDFGDVTVTNSALTGNSTSNQSAFGGAIDVEQGYLTVTGSTLSNNATTGLYSGGGAIRTVHKTTTITSSTLSGNHTTGADAEGGAIEAFSFLTVRDSTLSGNYTSGDSSSGGAILASNLGMEVTNSTIAGNSTRGNYGNGGAFIIFGSFGKFTFTNDTIVQNSAAHDGGGIAASGSPVTIHNSIVAQNTAGALGPDLWAGAGAGNLTVAHSLIGNNTDSGLAAAPVGSPDANGNLIGTGAAPINPLLAPLGFYGGPLETMALLPGSPALDMGSNTLAVDPGLDGIIGTADDVALTTDERGLPFARIAGTAVDAGAFEAQSFNLVVNRSDDTLDAVIDPAHLTLRDALALANDIPGLDTITFDPSLNGVPIDLTLGEFDISDTVTITGNGASKTIIDAQHNSRIFSIGASAGDVTLDGLTLENGASGTGGAISTTSTATLTIAHSTLSGNSATGNGGAVYTEYGAVVVTDSTFTGDSAAGGGGAIYGAAFITVTVTGSVFSGNFAGGGGGAIWLLIGDISVSNSTLSGNSSSGRGGAIFTDVGSVEVAASTLSGNSTTNTFASGGAIYSGRSVTLTDSTLSDNSTHGDRAYGGAVSAITDVIVTNSTLTGNSTSGPNANGGAISITDADHVTVVNSTIAGNKSAAGAGGGIYIRNNPNVVIRNSIVAENTDNGTGPDLSPGGATLTVRHSLIGDNTGTGLTAGSPDANGNLIGTFASPIDPLLGPLNFNGGPTQTMALLAGSPAIDAGDNSLALDPSTSSALTSDERGSPFVRIANGTVDMGAYEDQTVALSLVVTSTDDTLDPGYNPAHLTLRDAIALADGSIGADTITFDPSLNGVPIELSLGQMTITETVTIVGNGADKTIIDAQHQSRIFAITNTAGDVTIDGLTLENGQTTASSGAGSGGAIQSHSAGPLTITHSMLSGNSTQGDNAAGGAIYSEAGNVTVTSSTLDGNTTAGAGAGGGAIFALSGAVTITNGTIVGNSTAGLTASGGAIDAPSGNITITNSTIVQNEVVNAPGGGIFSNSSAAKITLRNTILAQNTDNGTAPDLSYVTGATVVITHSLIGDNTGTALTPAPVGSPDANRNLIGTGASPIDPMLSALASNGGPTQTMALLAGSPAIDAGSSAEATDPGPDGIPGNGDDIPLAADQRGLPFLRDVGVNVDMGAYEAQILNIVVNSADDTLDAVYNPAHVTLRDAVALTDGNPGLDTITFDAALNGTPIELSLGQLTITDSVTITGNGPAATIIDAQHNSRIFRISGLVGAVTLDGLTLENGQTAAPGSVGGAIASFTFGTLSILNSTLTGNSTTRIGSYGGAVYSLGDVTISNSLFASNSTSASYSYGGAVAVAFGDVTVTGSSFTGNSTKGNYAGGGAITTRAGDVTVTNSSFTGNSTRGYRASGGAIGVGSGRVTITGSTLSGNSTADDLADGGAIYNQHGSVKVFTSTLTNNSTAGNKARGGAISAGGQSVTITDSTLSGNSTGGFKAIGGAIAAYHNVIVTNSTITGNSTTGTKAVGGAIYSYEGRVTLTDSTIVQNHAVLATGGGVYAYSYLSKITLSNTILAQNTDSGVNPDLFYAPGTTVVISHSLIGNNQGTGLIAAPVGSPDVDGNLIGTAASPIDPRLGALSNNGGPTQTMALLANSPAINAGSNALAFDPGPDGIPGTGDDILLTTDQRGVPFARVFDGIVDMGAFEAQSLTLVVTSADDTLDAVYNPAHLTLRDAIAIANINPGLDTISFDASLNGTPINLAIGEFTITDTVAITGNGAAQTIIDAQQNSRIFDIAVGNATLRGLTLENGQTTANGDSGGAVLSTSIGTLTVQNSTFTGNSTTGNFAYGGAIEAVGPLVVTNSTFSGNSTGGTGASGGAIDAEGGLSVTGSMLWNNSTAGPSASGGAIFSNGFLIVTNSTLTGNLTAGTGANGGAIAAYGLAVVTNSTIVQNHAALGIGGGIYHDPSSGTALTLRNTILAQNTDNGTAPDGNLTAGTGTLTVQFSLIGKNTGTTLAAAPVGSPDANGNLVGTAAAPINPLLGALANNGGPTLTMALLSGSPAINAGNSALATDPGPDHIPGTADDIGLAFDQRGVPFVRLTGASVDIGAFETQSLSLVVTSTDDTLDAVYNPAHLTLRDAVALANINPGADTITFAAAINGTPIDLALGELLISDNLTITGNGALNTTIDAQHNSRVLQIASGVTASLAGLTITGGSVGTSPGIAGVGGGIVNQGALTISNSVITGNAAGVSGGGIENYSATSLSLTNCTISNNTAQTGAGVYSAGAGTFIATNCTISGNAASDAGGGLAGALVSESIINCTIDNNTALRGAGIYATAGTWTIEGSTVSNNQAGGAGGGIRNDHANLIVINSTFSGNTATTGGGIYFDTAPTILSSVFTDVTISNNRATSGSTAGGGVFVRLGNGVSSFTQSLTLQNTIVAGNFGGAAGSTAADVAGPLVAASSFNLIGDGTNMTGISNGTNSNQVGTFASPINAHLGLLANNGGPTRTMALLAGSPAVAAGALFNDPSHQPITTDQRGLTRIAGAVDMGAFQSATIGSITRNAPPSSPTNAVSVTFNVTFNQPVANVLPADFTASAGTVGPVTPVNSSSYNVTVSGLAAVNGTLTFGIAAGQTITDAAGNPLLNTALTGTNQNTYVLDHIVPTTVSFVRHAPANNFTNAATLVFRIMFSEAVINVATTAFAVTGASTATVTAFAPVPGTNGSQYDVTVSGGNLATFSGVVGLAFSPGEAITDPAGNAVANTTPAINQSYTVDHSSPVSTAFGGQYAALLPGTSHYVLAFIVQNGNQLTLGLGTTFNTATVTSTTQLLVGGATTAQYSDSQITFAGTGAFAGQVWTKLSLPADYMSSTGQATHISQNGTTSLLFINGLGQSSPGFWLNPTQVVATGFNNQIGTVGNGRIVWSTGEVWNMNLVLNGTSSGAGSTNITAGPTTSSSPFDAILTNYSDPGTGLSPVVVQNGTNTVLFVDGDGTFALGTFLNATQVQIPAWQNVVATFSSGQIHFSNNRVWNQTTPVPSAVTITRYLNLANTLPQYVIQNGSNTLAVINGHGGFALGTFSSGQTVATVAAWGNDVGTFSSGQITWSDGSHWAAQSGAPPQLTIHLYVKLANNLPQQLTLQGTTLMFLNGNGQLVSGQWINATQAVVAAWGNDVATFSNGQIAWSDGGVWTQTDTASPPVIISNYVNAANGLAQHAVQNGTSTVAFMNARGATAIGTFINATQAVVADWSNLVATFGSNQITWSNGTTWSATTSVSPLTAVVDTRFANVGNNLVTHLIEQGSNVPLFINGHGVMALGFWTSSNKMTVPAWGNDVGTIGSGAMSWSDGSVWSQMPMAPLQIAATDPNHAVSHLEILSINTLIGLDGPMQGVLATRVNGKLFWSNGAVWDNLNLDLLNALFEMGAGYP